ncbi:MAG TPA: ABC transporter permease [Ruminococcus sp.]|nr:ABC transporter permease [Ruminococcus sp.]
MKWIRPLLLLGSLAAAEIIAFAIPDSPKHQTAAHPYFAILLLLISAVYLIGVFVSRMKQKNSKEPPEHPVFYRAPFLAGVFLFLNLLNLFTVKTAIFPVLYFPSLDRVFGTLFEDRSLILKCIGFSTGILLKGVFGGLVIGFIMGVAVGFSKTAAYWINPIIRILGPIPSTAWIPVLLVVFAEARSASAFIIGISVWFPTVVLTSSGISNVRNSYFEVSSTLGANTWQRIVKIGIPAAMPSIFLGLFNGICGSFVALMTAEMIGAKYGIGWYVHWQKEMMAYSNVYAGLIVIAVLFYVIITLLFKVRDRILNWQKGVIKW